MVPEPCKYDEAKNFVPSFPCATSVDPFLNSCSSAVTEQCRNVVRL